MARLPKLERGDIVVVHWIDAHSVDEWTEHKDLEEKLKPARTVNVGYYLKTTHHAVVIAASVGEELEEDRVGGTWVIPKGMIEKVEVLKRHE